MTIRSVCAGGSPGHRPSAFNSCILSGTGCQSCNQYGAFFLLLLLMFMVVGGGTEAMGKTVVRGELKLHSVGEDVQYLQDCLKQAGYLEGGVDGCFGPATRAAVLRLQREQGLASDGIVGTATWVAVEALLAAEETVHIVQAGDTLWTIARNWDTTVSLLAEANGISNPDRLSIGATLIVPDARGSSRTALTKVTTMHWNDVQKIFPKASTATVIDVKTGARFQIRRLFGTNHADVEPLTKADTRTIRRFLGGKWSWDRRPIVVEIGSHRIAASMNGYPHGQSTIDNDFPGHFCVHFLGSRLHSGNRTDKDHQAAVLQAARYEGR